MKVRKTPKSAPLSLALTLTRVAVPLALAAAMSPATAQISVATPGGQLSQAEQEAVNAQAMLTGALKRIAANGNDGNALIDAGNAAITLDDANAAMGFFNRANSVWPNNPRVLSGMGQALVRLENPTEALRLFQLAVSKGASERGFLTDRAFAYDLMGDNERAQKDYQMALQSNYSDRALRLYALSLGISGDTDKAVQTIAPLLQKRDRAAWRDRAFILAMNGRTKEALDIVKQTMPANVASGITPYIMKMDRLSNKQLAAAVHFGQFPSSDTQLAAVGRKDKSAAAAVSATPAAARATANQNRGKAAPPAQSDAGRDAGPRFVDENGRPVKLSKAEQRRLIQEQEEKKKAEAAAQEQQRLAAVQRQQEEARQAEAARVAEQTRLAEAKRQEDIRLANQRKQAEDARLAEAKRIEEAKEWERIRLASAQAATPPVAPSTNNVPASAPVAAPTTIAAATPSTPGFSNNNPATPATNGGLIGPTNNNVAPTITPASLPPSTAAIGATPAVGTSPAVATTTTGVGTVGTASAGIGTNTEVAAAVPASVSTGAPAAPAAEDSFKAFSLSDLVLAVKPPEEAPARNEGYVDLATLEKLRADKIAADRAAAAKAKAEADKKKAAEAKLAKEKELADAKAKEAEAKKKASQPKVWAQIATGSGTNKFTSDLRKAKSRDAALFKGKDGSRIETGKMSRLVIGPFANVKEANAWLAKYKKAGGDGFVWTSKGDEDVKPVAK